MANQPQMNSLGGAETEGLRLSVEERPFPFSGRRRILRLVWGGRTLFAHSLRRPWIRWRWGRADIRGHHAAWRFRGKWFGQAVLGAWEIEEETPRRVIILWGGVLRTCFSLAGEDRLELTLEYPGADAAGPWGDHRLEFRWVMPRDEGIYGGGEQYSHFNLKGHRVPLWVSEPGVGRHWSDPVWWPAQLGYGAGGTPFTTYFPQTSFITSGGFSFLAWARGFSRFDFTCRDTCRLEFWSLPERMVLGRSAGPAEALSGLTSVIGRQPRMPDWCFQGLWLGLQGGRRVVEEKTAEARRAGIALAAVWCQDWPGQKQTSFGKQVYWNWRYSEELYPNLPDLIRNLREQDIRFLGYINTFLDPGGDQYREARDRGFLLVKGTATSGGVDSWGVDSGADAANWEALEAREAREARVSITSYPVPLLDLSNPEACRWVKKIIKDNMIGLGMAGWMADFGEYVPPDAAPADGSSSTELHNRYPVEWARLNREAVEEAGVEGQAVVFHRSGFTGSAPWTMAVWNGDQLVQFRRHDGLASIITACLSLGMSGIGNVHCDIGGYTTVGWRKRSKDLYLRWLELAAFMPVMRTHEGNRPEENWQYDSSPETLELTARMTAVHNALGPYHRALAEEYQESGMPPMRPDFFYGGREKSCGYPDSYFYGQELFVAPILRKGTKRRRVHLPPGRWIHLWSGRGEPGERRISVQSPWGEPPVFYREDSPWEDLFLTCRRAAEGKAENHIKREKDR